MCPKQIFNQVWRWWEAGDTMNWKWKPALQIISKNKDKASWRSDCNILLRAQTMLQLHRPCQYYNMTIRSPPLTSGSDHCFSFITTLTQIPSSHLGILSHKLVPGTYSILFRTDYGYPNFSLNSQDISPNAIKSLSLTPFMVTPKFALNMLPTVAVQWINLTFLGSRNAPRGLCSLNHCTTHFTSYGL